MNTVVASAEQLKRKGSKNQVTTAPARIHSARTGGAAVSIIFLGKVTAGGSS